MAQFLCPRCGSHANILLNLVSCLTPDCRNYDQKWSQIWQANNSPRFQHNLLMGTNHRYLGRYDDKVMVNIANNSTVPITFDLHSYKSPQGLSVCLARCGNADSECYYVDERETEIGLLSAGPLAACPTYVVRALKECLKRFRGK